MHMTLSIDYELKVSCTFSAKHQRIHTREESSTHPPTGKINSTYPFYLSICLHENWTKPYNFKIPTYKSNALRRYTQHKSQCLR